MNKSDQLCLGVNEKQELNKGEKLIPAGAVCPWDGLCRGQWCWDAIWACNSPLQDAGDRPSSASGRLPSASHRDGQHVRSRNSLTPSHGEKKKRALKK